MSETQEPNPVADMEKLAARVSELVTRVNLHKIASQGKFCAMCWEEIDSALKDDPEALYHEVVSWVTGPKLQSPVLRTQSGRLAHASCVHKVLDGQSPDQESIPGIDL